MNTGSSKKDEDEDRRISFLAYLWFFIMFGYPAVVGVLLIITIALVLLSRLGGG